MTKHISINLEQLSVLEKEYKWKKPSACPKCNSKLWGHGFVGRLFYSFSKPLFLKRYRCSNKECHLVLSLRPCGYWKWYQSSKVRIYEALRHRLRKLRWPPWCTRQRGGHWLRKLIAHVTFLFGIHADPYVCIERLNSKELHFFE